jgi:hypothetical protein
MLLTLRHPAGANLIVNGDFESGNVSFSSDYVFGVTDSGEGEYSVGSSPQAFNQFFSNTPDHTTGIGKMMLVNSSPQTGAVVWSQTVPVEGNLQYSFTAWATTLYPSSPANLRFTINGAQIGANFSPGFSTGTWSKFSTTWNAGGSTSALIRIVNLNTDWSGNDFAIDDLSLVPEPTVLILLIAGLPAALLRMPRRLNK